MKIIISYFQFISLLFTFPIEVSLRLKVSLNFFTKISPDLSDAFSIDCILSDLS